VGLRESSFGIPLPVASLSQARSRDHYPLSSRKESCKQLGDKFWDGFEPDVVLFGKEAYEFLKNQVNQEFGGEDSVSEISGLSIRVVDEFGKDAVIVDSKVLGLGLGGAKRLKVIKD